jgi:hypothetical protein
MCVCRVSSLLPPCVGRDVEVELVAHTSRSHTERWPYHPITMSCLAVDGDKPMVVRTSRLLRARSVSCVSAMCGVRRAMSRGLGEEMRTSCARLCIVTHCDTVRVPRCSHPRCGLALTHAYVSAGDVPLVTRSTLPSRHAYPAALSCWPGMALWARPGALGPGRTRTCRGAAIHMAMIETRLMPMAQTNAGPYVPVAS